ncbi:MAG: galactokinase [Gemmatimonadetes bacterium]|nr:galactokinase [Gemmatimonadota bacterium]
MSDGALVAGLGDAPDGVRRIFVPGRIELFGKHVDYGGGPSLTCAIDDGITADWEPIERPVIEVEDLTTGRRTRVPLKRDARTGGAHGGTYVTAVARRLARDFSPLKVGVRVRSSSTLPRSSGLSSSSAFVTMLTLALSEANRLRERRAWRDHIASPLAFAEYCGAIEMGGAFGPFTGDKGVGTRGGAQDHVAIICNEAEAVGAYSYLPATRVGRASFPAHWSILVGVSGVRATKTGGALADYNRASDVVRDLLGLWNRGTGRLDASLGSALRSAPDAAARLSDLARNAPDAPWFLARIEQFRAETERMVPQALQAFETADADLLGRLSVESQQRAETALHNQIPETMFLARAAMAAGAHGSTAFGAGFGGAVWAVVDRERAEEVRDRWKASYAAAFPQRAGKAEWLLVRPGAGVRLP